MEFPRTKKKLEKGVLKESDERGSGTRKLSPMLHSPRSQYDIPGVQLGEKRLYSVDGSFEKVFEWQEMGIFIHVPAGVVLPGYLCEITISSVLAGKFLFPKELILVSGIFAISTSCDILRPIRIHLQHCVNFSRDMEEDLTFAKADYIGRSPPYHFEVCGGAIFTSELQYKSLYGALECQKFSFFGILARIRSWFTIRYKAQLLLNSRQWKAHVTVTKDIVSLLQNMCGSFEDCENITDATFSFAGNEVTVETEKESEDHQWEIKPLQNPCKIQRADVNAYGPGSERSIPKLNFKLEPKPGCKAKLYHEMKIKGATEPSLSLYLSCSPASIGTPNITALTDKTAIPLLATSISTPIATEQPQKASVTSVEGKDTGNTIVTAEIHQTFVPPPEVSSREEPHTILKRQVPLLSRAISNPDRLATDMWSNDLISDEVRDILDRRDLSRFDKNNKLLTEMHRHLENSSSSQQLLGTFCSVLKGQGDPTLNQIADEMVKFSD